MKMQDNLLEIKKDNYIVDPRVKLVLSLCMTTLVIYFNSCIHNGIVCLIALSIAIFFKSNIKTIFLKFKKYILVFFILCFVQSIFVREGIAIVKIGDIALLTDKGIYSGLAFFFRICVIVLSGVIISTSRGRDVIQSLIQMKIPYEIVFMTSIGILFVPTLATEIRTSTTAIELRGIEINKMKLKDRANLYVYLVIPVVLRTVNTARMLSTAMDVRAFRLYDTRSSIKTLTMQKIDWILIFLCIILTLFALFI